MFAGFASPMPGEDIEKKENKEAKPGAYSDIWEQAGMDDVEFAGDKATEETGEIPETEQVLEGNLNERLSEAEAPDTVEEWFVMLKIAYMKTGQTEEVADGMARDALKTVFSDDMSQEDGLSADNKQQLMRLYAEVASRAAGVQAELDYSDKARYLTDFTQSLESEMNGAALPSEESLTAKSDTGGGESTPQPSSTISHFVADAAPSGFASRVTGEAPNTTASDEPGVKFDGEGEMKNENNSFIRAAKESGNAPTDIIADEVIHEAGFAGAKNQIDGAQRRAQEVREKLDGDGGAEKRVDSADGEQDNGPDKADVTDLVTHATAEAAAANVAKRDALDSILDGSTDELDKAQEVIDSAKADIELSLDKAAAAGINADPALKATESLEESAREIDEARTLAEANAEELQDAAEGGGDEDGGTEQMMGIFGDGGAPIGDIDELKQKLNERSEKKKEDEEKEEDKKPAFDFGAYADPLANE